MSLIHFDYSNALIPQYGITQEGLARLEDRLSASRQEVLDDVQLFHSGSTPVEYKQPLDAGFTDLPQRLLKEYRAAQKDSELGQILSRTKELADKVDRVVVLGIGGSYMGAKALMAWKGAARRFSPSDHAGSGGGTQGFTLREITSITMRVRVSLTCLAMAIRWQRKSVGAW